MAASAPAQAPGLGHNRPPEPLDVTLVTSDVAVLQARLERQYQPMTRRFVELGLGAKKVPARIATEQEATTVVTWLGKQCNELIAEAEKAHAVEKAPYWNPGKVVDRFFNDRIKILKDLIGPALRRAEQYLEFKKAEVRRREEAERRRAQAALEAAETEAARRRQAAAEAEAAGDRNTAIEQTQMAEREEANAALATAIIERPPEPVVIRGEAGSTAFSVEKWDYKVLDRAAVPVDCLTIDDAAVRQLIAAGARDRDIPGLEIFPNDQFRIRRC
jgi:hypothetical protein